MGRRWVIIRAMDEWIRQPAFAQWIEDSLARRENILAVSNQGTLLRCRRDGLDLVVKAAMGRGPVRALRQRTLLREGVVALAPSPQPAHPGRSLRAGRPVQRYTLALPAARHNLGPLAAALFNLLLARTPPDQHPALVRELAAEMAASAPGRSPSPPAPLPRGEGGMSAPYRSLTLRLANAVLRLNEMGYRARWEAHASGPRLILGHCPYAALAPGQPQLCALDAALPSALSGERVVQQVRLEPSASGLPYCLFQID